MSFAEAKQALRSMQRDILRADSYARLDCIIDLYYSTPDELRRVWFRALGYGWDICDNIYSARAVLSEIFLGAARKELDAIMTAREREALAKLPEVVTIYRGCFARNRAGLSWTLDKATAERFTTLNRYCRPGESRLVVAAKIRKSRIVAVKLARNESEVIAIRPKVQTVETLPPIGRRATAGEAKKAKQQAAQILAQWEASATHGRCTAGSAA